MLRFGTLLHGDVVEPPGGRGNVHRLAVRGVVQRAGEVLLVRTDDGELKLPGGRVEDGESGADAVRREVAEETGAVVVDVEGPWGEVVEHAPAMEPDHDVFTMTSQYYLCSVEDSFGEQRLDAYERDHGMAPVWLDVDEAVRTVRSLGAGRSRWTARELLVLERLAAER
jgi:8-oxo-dGTP diphosphatase